MSVCARTPQPAAGCRLPELLSLAPLEAGSGRWSCRPGRGAQPAARLLRRAPSCPVAGPLRLPVLQTRPWSLVQPCGCSPRAALSGSPLWWASSGGRSRDRAVELRSQGGPLRRASRSLRGQLRALARRGLVARLESRRPLSSVPPALSPGSVLALWPRVAGWTSWRPCSGWAKGSGPVPPLGPRLCSQARGRIAPERAWSS